MPTDPPSSHFSETGWVTVRGPANWFRLRSPEELQVSQSQSVMEIRLPGPQSGDSESDDAAGPLLMSLAAWWDESESPESARRLPDLSILFPTVTALHQLSTLPGGDCSEVWGGFSRRAAVGCWLSRIFGRRARYEWRLWVFRRGDLTVLATAQSADRTPLDPTRLALCESLLKTLQLADNPAWPPDTFQKQVVRLAREHFPLLQSASVRGFSVRLGQSELGLSNFYRMYLQAPDQFRRIVLPGLTSLVRMQELSPAQLIPDFSEVRERILPMLAPDDDSRHDERVRQPWVGGLSIGYVVDEDDSYRYIHRQMLENWDVTCDDLHEAALENLQEYARSNPLSMTVVGEEDNPQMLMPVRPDAYNCSRILDPTFHQQLRELFGPQLVMGLPNRDFFVCVSLREPGLIQQVRQRVREDHATMHHPLTQRLLLISPDGVSEYVDP
ncbi:MAG: hypothetical protein RLZZ436_1073 [Planctomycetota bacterium]